MNQEPSYIYIYTYIHTRVCVCARVCARVLFTGARALVKKKETP